jgi:hypothetical protein
MPPDYLDTARKILKETRFDFVLLAPQLTNFYTRFEGGSTEPICDPTRRPLPSESLTG